MSRPGEVPARPQTRRADRSVPSRLAPGTVLVLGLLYVAAAVVRLDGIYDGNPGVLRSTQVTPAPVAAGHEILGALGRAFLAAIRTTGFGTQLCERPRFADLCTPRPPGSAPRLEQEDAQEPARSLVAGAGAGTVDRTDVSVVGWDVGRDGIVVVAVARFPSAGAAAQALAAASAVGRDEAVAGHPGARTVWLAGKHVLVGVLASASDQAAADDLLARSRPQVAAYVEMSRVFWFEALALGPLLVLFTTWVLARYLLPIPFFAMIAAVGLVAIAVLVPVLVVALVRRRLARRRSAGAATVAAPAPAAPAEGPLVNYRQVDAPRVWIGQGPDGQYAFLVVVVLIGFGIAAMTTALFPGSIAWGSLVLAALCATPRWARDMPYLARVRKALRWLLGVAVASMFIGFAPYRLLGLPPIQVACAVLGIAMLVGQWRDLTAGTELAYTEWYEDVDARSTVFLVGAAVLTIGAGALFLAGNGSPDLGAQFSEKALAAPGLLVALTASAHVRASRDAARREKARERGTPPVLYLRSFGDDELKVVSPRMQRLGLERLSWRRRELFEDVIARSLSRMGPVVAIAKPGTGQRDLGPARDTIVTDDWLGAVRTYMGEAVLVAVVLGSSDGLVRELETLGELGLLDRLCLFVPPVSDAEVARRLAVLGRQRGYSNTWGALREGKKHKILALTSIGTERCVVTAPRRTAFAYRQCVADMPAVRPAGARTDEPVAGRTAPD